MEIFVPSASNSILILIPIRKFLSHGNHYIIRLTWIWKYSLCIMQTNALLAISFYRPYLFKFMNRNVGTYQGNPQMRFPNWNVIIIIITGKCVLNTTCTSFKLGDRTSNNNNNNKKKNRTLKRQDVDAVIIIWRLENNNIVLSDISSW